MTESKLSAEARYCLLLLREDREFVFNCSLKVLAQRYAIPLRALRSALDYMEENDRLEILVKGRLGKGKSYEYRLNFDGISLLPDIGCETLYSHMQKTITLKEWNVSPKISGLRVSQKMFLLILAAHAETSGMVRELSYSSIRKSMGSTFTKSRYRNQISKLKNADIISFYRPGFTDNKILGKVSSSYAIDRNLFSSNPSPHIDILFNCESSLINNIVIGDLQLHLLKLSDLDVSSQKQWKALVSLNSKPYLCEHMDKIVSKLLCFNASCIKDKKHSVHQWVFEQLPLLKVFPHLCENNKDVEGLLSEAALDLNIIDSSIEELLKLNVNDSGKDIIDREVLTSYLWVLKFVASMALKRALALRIVLDAVNAPSGEGVTYFLTPIEYPIFKISISFCDSNNDTDYALSSVITLKQKSTSSASWFFYKPPEYIDLNVVRWIKIMSPKNSISSLYVDEFLVQKTHVNDKKPIDIQSLVDNLNSS
ncbi:hypothetical protein ACXJY6_06775 [Vibrio sp. RC27]